MSLVFVDCEAVGPCPALGRLKEFGAVIFETKATFHGILIEGKEAEVFHSFAEWLKANVKGRPVFVSDNPAYDWQWINDGLHRFLGHNPFGHSARRISDFYAGLCGDFYKTRNWETAANYATRPPSGSRRPGECRSVRAPAQGGALDDFCELPLPYPTHPHP